MNRLPFDLRLPKSTEPNQYLDLMRIRLGELFTSIITQINSAADGFVARVTTQTAAYTVQGSDQIVLINNSGNIVVTLPKPSDTLNKIFTVKKISNNGNTVTITPASGNIDGAATKVITTYLVSHEIASDGANYWIL